MPPFHRLARGLARYALAAAASGSLSSGCGNDGDTFKSTRRGGSGGTSGGAGSATGGTTAGDGGSPTGGSSGNSSGGGGGMPVTGSGGSTAGSGGSIAGNAGSAGSAGTGTSGDNGMGGVGQGGEGGVGQGGEGGVGQGGSSDAVCKGANLSIALVSATPPQAHDHLPIVGAAGTTLLDIINSGMPLTFTLPVEGSNPHDHTLTFTPQELTTLRNGGTVAMITSSTGGPPGNLHTHTYSIECAP